MSTGCNVILKYSSVAPWLSQFVRQSICSQPKPYQRDNNTNAAVRSTARICGTKRPTTRIRVQPGGLPVTGGRSPWPRERPLEPRPGGSASRRDARIGTVSFELLLSLDIEVWSFKRHPPPHSKSLRTNADTAHLKPQRGEMFIETRTQAAPYQGNPIRFRVRFAQTGLLRWLKERIEDRFVHSNPLPS